MVRIDWMKRCGWREIEGETWMERGGRRELDGQKWIERDRCR
jgi:hypothetical protein